MESSPIAGKSWQPSYEPQHRKGEQAPVILNRQWRGGGNGWGKTAWTKRLMFFVVNAIKLHLPAFNNCITDWGLGA
ncbi:unnamed protein product [Pocillopora meandrina]|uniref:Uncharacterized protein n=1 Tax=Pocillopora meandrina TaxID=46732 RepID=A0AAU9X194_9CNID|nr:unnamed protein product [Pocillopora meandrina]